MSPPSHPLPHLSFDLPSASFSTQWTSLVCFLPVSLHSVTQFPNLMSLCHNFFSGLDTIHPRLPEELFFFCPFSVKSVGSGEPWILRCSQNQSTPINIPHCLINIARGTSFPGYPTGKSVAQTEFIVLSALLLPVSCSSCVPPMAGGPPSTLMPKPETCPPRSAPPTRYPHASVTEFWLPESPLFRVPTAWLSA